MKLALAQKTGVFTRNLSRLPSPCPSPLRGEGTCSRQVNENTNPKDFFRLVILASAIIQLLTGCVMLGPDYMRPSAPLSERWIETGDTAVSDEATAETTWWAAFNDSVLNTLVETAYYQNPSLHAAGVRVVEAQARRGITIGLLFPQQQDAFGDYTQSELSTRRANRSSALDATFENWQVGFDAAWELDLWGRFRRGIEAADAELLAAVATYDDILVSLIAEVAANYVQLRTLEERLNVAYTNVSIQERSFEIADAKFEGGVVTELDAAQARSLLRDTQAQIPILQAGIRQTQNTLCILLGIPPRDLRDVLGDPQPIPISPPTVTVGIPADLLRRRPDIRRAERLLAAQSAQIGIAQADLFPSFSLLGTVSVAAEDFTDLFDADSLENFGGPSFRWAILNYGRIRNNVRVQDARFQALISDYENVVLQAQGEVENAIAAYLGAQRQVQLLTSGVESAARAVELADLQYREGAVDYTRVLTTQQFLVTEQDRLISTRGGVALNLIALYKALGGGWELRQGYDFIPEQTREEMQQRTYWATLLSAEEQAAAVDAALSGTENDQGMWRWRVWEPQW